LGKNKILPYKKNIFILGGAPQRVWSPLKNVKDYADFIFDITWSVYATTRQENLDHYNTHPGQSLERFGQMIKPQKKNCVGEPPDFC